jgi:potassium-transporting ATPase ATP-binding subunit
MAEGRGKAQADTLRKAKTETIAHRITADTGDTSQGIKRFTTVDIPAPKLRKGDLVFVGAGEFIPGDGEVVEGVAIRLS